MILVALAAWFFPVIGAGVWYRGKAHTLRDANVVGTFQPGIRMTIHISSLVPHLGAHHCSTGDGGGAGCLVSSCDLGRVPGIEARR